MPLSNDSGRMAAASSQGNIAHPRTRLLWPSLRYLLVWSKKVTDTRAVKMGRYLIERRLGFGGMAEVFLARMEGPASFQKHVVIKRILPHFAEDQLFVDMFLDEARLAARFNHPNLVQVYELTKLGGQYSLVMEHIEGRDLRDILDRRTDVAKAVPLEVAAAITAAVADGLHCAHELRDEEGKPLHVVHRDVSPGNIIVTRYGGVKLVDFGIAKHEERSVETQGHGIKGKLAYMAPEQAGGLTVDARTDIFSLGVVLYETLTGVPLFRSDTLDDVLEFIESGEYVPVRELRPDVPLSLEDVVRRMLARDPTDRWQDAAAVKSALTAINDYPTAGATETAEFVNALFETTTLGQKRSRDTARVATAIVNANWVSASGTLVDPSVVIENDTLAKSDTLRDLTRTPEITPVSRRTSRRLSRAVRRAMTPQRRRWSGWVPALVMGLLLGVAVWQGFERRAAEFPVLKDIPSLASPKAVLTLESVPSGATVYFNGKPRAGVTPMTVRDLSVGRHFFLRFEKDGYEPVDYELRVLNRKPEPLRVSMNKAARPISTNAGVPTKAGTATPTAPSRDRPGLLIVDSSPRMDVYVDKRRLGSTPVKMSLPSGPTTVTLRNTKLGLGRTLRLSIPAGGRVTKRVIFSKGWLRVDAEPWANVYVGKKRIGTTPLAPISLYEGTHRLRLVNPKARKKEYVVAVEVRPGKTTKVFYDFRL